MQFIEHLLGASTGLQDLDVGLKYAWSDYWLRHTRLWHEQALTCTIYNSNTQATLMQALWQSCLTKVTLFALHVGLERTRVNLRIDSCMHDTWTMSSFVVVLELMARMRDALAVCMWLWAFGLALANASVVHLCDLDLHLRMSFGLTFARGFLRASLKTHAWLWLKSAHVFF